MQAFSPKQLQRTRETTKEIFLQIFHFSHSYPSHCHAEKELKSNGAC